MLRGFFFSHEKCYFLSLVSFGHERLGRRLPRECHEIELPPPGLILPFPPPSRTTFSTFTNPQSFSAPNWTGLLLAKSIAQSKLPFHVKKHRKRRCFLFKNHSSLVNPPPLPPVPTPPGNRNNLESTSWATTVVQDSSLSWPTCLTRLLLLTRNSLFSSLTKLVCSLPMAHAWSSP